MDWIDRMNNALDYIESNLTDEISYDKAAQIACCSTYHFQRMFSFIANVPLSEYIKRRRLTLAAFELQGGNTKVIDVAFKYGYEAPESFSRAFKGLHGITPSSVNGKGVQLKAYPRISFRISIKGGVEVNYKVEKKPEFTVFGVEKFVTPMSAEIGEFWGEFLGSEQCEKLPLDEQANSYHAIMSHKEWVDGKMPYMICTIKKEGMDTAGFSEAYIPAAEWAIFTTATVQEIGPALGEIWGKIFSEWFPTSNYEHAPLPECEFYYEVDDGEYAEVWIPVKAK